MELRHYSAARELLAKPGRKQRQGPRGRSERAQLMGEMILEFAGSSRGPALRSLSKAWLPVWALLVLWCGVCAPTLWLFSPTEGSGEAFSSCFLFPLVVIDRAWDHVETCSRHRETLSTFNSHHSAPN